MSIPEVIKLVNEVTGIDVTCIKGKPCRPLTHARYAAILIMSEEGIELKQIAAALHIERSMPYKSLYRINHLLEPVGLKTGSHIKESSEFKAVYLACIKRLAEMEEAA